MKKITSEVSINEMLELRKQGMSNKDIARALEISYASVLRYIGKQQERMDSIAALEPVKVREVEPTPPPAPPAPPFFKVSKERMVARDFVVHLDYDARQVDIHSEAVHVKVTGYDKLVGLMDVISNVLARVAKEEV